MSTLPPEDPLRLKKDWLIAAGWYPCQCGLQVRDCHQRLLTQPLFWQALGMWPMCVVITTTIWLQTISYPFRWPRLLFWLGLLHSKAPMNLVIPLSQIRFLSAAGYHRQLIMVAFHIALLADCMPLNGQHLHRVLRRGRKLNIIV